MTSTPTDRRSPWLVGIIIAIVVVVAINVAFIVIAVGARIPWCRATAKSRGERWWLMARRCAGRLPWMGVAVNGRAALLICDGRAAARQSRDVRRAPADAPGLPRRSLTLAPRNDQRALPRARLHPLRHAPGVRRRALLLPGCETAYAIIHGAGLERTTPSAPPRPRAPVDPVVGWSADPARSSAPTAPEEVRLQVDGLRCASCVWVARACAGANPGVDPRHGQLRHRARLDPLGPARIDLSSLATRIAALGYRPRALGVETAPDRALL